ncbi:hypothetical protein ACFWBC_10325 [Streptomyces sp. NPDC059985]|uniref:hypothetical protein n=1 Tax=Streptomyces sp. NPDC059985 TaxID=3347025 RepID=UPI0036944733
MPETERVSRAAHHRWMRAAANQLTTFIEQAQKNDLPELTWTLATTGALTGEAVSLASTPEQQREAIRRWADHMGVTVDSRRTTDGREELFAGWEIAGPTRADISIRGCFRATIHPSDDEYTHHGDNYRGAFFEAQDKLFDDPELGAAARELRNRDIFGDRPQPEGA